MAALSGLAPVWRDGAGLPAPKIRRWHCLERRMETDTQGRRITRNGAASSARRRRASSRASPALRRVHDARHPSRRTTYSTSTLSNKRKRSTQKIKAHIQPWPPRWRRAMPRRQQQLGGGSTADRRRLMRAPVDSRRIDSRSTAAYRGRWRVRRHLAAGQFNWNNRRV